MKSIIQEASSIAKAVEEGWIKAQKPQEFSVKILEEAEKNFLGLTRKSAKVAIFFDETHAAKSIEPRTTQQINRPKRQPQQAQQRALHEKQPILQQQAPKQKHQSNAHQVENAPLMPSGQAKKQFEPLWNQAMVDRTQQWMDEAFRNSNNKHIQFTVEPQKFHLRITLSAPILSDQDKEKQLLASFSALILETLKRSFKMSLRGHKIVLTHKNSK
ncbi:MAG: hypothetical protein K2X90_04300 [Candidatus Babeliaceae bacterium]|nr:hypothetical protein [Candidatus Babeliaceae bacterium]